MEYNKLRVELGALSTALFYSAQEERINALNRIRQVVFRELEGIDLTEKQNKKDEPDYEKKYTDRQLLKMIRDNLINMNDDNKEYVEKLLLVLDSVMKKESEYKTLMQTYIEKEPIYTEFLERIKGISTLNTANLLQYFGYCEKAKHASSLWKFAGLHVVNNKAPKLGMYGKGKEVEKLDYSPKLRTLMYRVGDCFIKQRTPKYRDIYDREKEKQVKMLEEWTNNLTSEQQKELKKIDTNEKKRKFVDQFNTKAPCSLLNADSRARRKMVKHFLVDYYENCLRLRGIEPDKCYAHRND